MLKVPYKIHHTPLQFPLPLITYGIMTDELVICEIIIDEAAGRGDSDSWMASFEFIMLLKLQSTKM